jgi:hypothetical protein
LIFNLNQDLLLERHYFNNNVMLSDRRTGRWNGWEIIGVKKRQMATAGFIVPGEENVGIWVPHEDPVVHERSQPYIKLHGSSNWRDARDTRIWVMGTNKRVTLGHFPFLTKLHDLFRQYLSNGPVRLMVIGYSFNDEHVNEMIMCAAERGQLQLFIIDPLGIGVLDKNVSHAIYSENQLLQRLKSHVIGASRRTLSEIFGTAHVEHHKVMSFFPPEWRPRDRPWPNIGG